MNFSNFGNLLGPRGGVSRGAQKPGYAKYDDLAGAAMLRRAGKAAAPAHGGDQASRLLVSRRRNDVEDRLSLKLRDFYQELLGEPVPDRLIDLVKSLKVTER